MVLCNNLIAQQDDFRTRSSIEIEKDFKKGFDVGITYEYRSFQNATAFQGSFFSLSPSYRINDTWSANITLRFATSNTTDRFRIANYISARKKVEKIQFSFRAGYLHEWSLQELPEINQNLQTDNLRLRLKADRKIFKKTHGHLSIEPVLNLQEAFQLNQIRNTIGVDYEIFKNNIITLDWFWQPRFDPQYLFSTHSVCFNYLIKI